jgi:hypothetical protein
VSTLRAHLNRIVFFRLCTLAIIEHVSLIQIKSWPCDPTLTDIAAGIWEPEYSLIKEFLLGGSFAGARVFRPVW